MKSNTFLPIGLIFIILYFFLFSFFISCKTDNLNIDKNQTQYSVGDVAPMSDSVNAIVQRPTALGLSNIYQCASYTYGVIYLLSIPIVTSINGFSFILIHGIVVSFIILIYVIFKYFELNIQEVKQ